MPPLADREALEEAWIERELLTRPIFWNLWFAPWPWCLPPMFPAPREDGAKPAARWVRPALEPALDAED